MRYLIRAKYERYFINRFFVISLLSTVFFGIASVLLIQEFVVSFDKLPENFFDSLKYGGSYNFGVIRINDLDYLFHPTIDKLVVNLLSSYAIQTIIGISVCKYVCDDFSYKYIYLEISKGYKKTEILFSYFLIISSYTFIITLLYVISFVVFGLLSGFPIGHHSLSSILYTIISQEILIGTFSIACVVIALLVKNSLKSTLFIISVIYVLPVAISYIKAFYKIEINFEKYWILSRLPKVSICHDYFLDLLVSIGTIVVFVLLGIWVMNKRILER